MVAGRLAGVPVPPEFDDVCRRIVNGIGDVRWLVDVLRGLERRCAFVSLEAISFTCSVSEKNSTRSSTLFQKTVRGRGALFGFSVPPRTSMHVK